MYSALANKEKKLAVVGLGYVGLPIALAFAKHFKVVGFDINSRRVEMLQRREDPSREMPPSAFEGRDITFTANPEDLRTAHFFVVAVPTPIDEHKTPDLKPVLSASRTLKGALKPGDYVVFESTVYPGCTEEDCVPILEESGLKMTRDFMVGYSPERINPGDTKHTLENTIKIVSGCCADSLEEIAKVYETVIEAGVHRAASIKVAEAAKVIENTQRDLNIALMNELAIIFEKMGISTSEVLQAAGTKWNFHGYYPGLVGGHCIGVDPYYLTYKAEALGHHARVILAGRQVNDSMGKHVAQRLVKLMIAQGKDVAQTRVLVMGATFKENVADIRNSKVADVVNELISFKVNVDWTDPFADPAEVQHEYGHDLLAESALRKDYDGIVVAVAHDTYRALEEAFFLGITKSPAVLVDIRNLYRGKINQLEYWSL